jgi:hypothetical protein
VDASGPQRLHDKATKWELFTSTRVNIDMPAQDTLDTVQVSTPCPAAWDAMAGDDQRRFCAHCHKHVHNLSAMSSNDAERLFCASAGDLCVRFARDPQTSRIITLDYRPPPVSSRRRAMLVIASLVAALGVSGAWAAVRIFGKPPAPVPTIRMGELMPVAVSNPPTKAHGSAVGPE